MNRLVALLFAGIAFLTPYGGRLCGAAINGWPWFSDYVQSAEAVIVGALLNLLYAFVVYRLALVTTSVTAARIGIIVSVLYVGIAHCWYLDLHSGSTAGAGLAITPVFAAILASAVWAITDMLWIRQK